MGKRFLQVAAIEYEKALKVKQNLALFDRAEEFKLRGFLELKKYPLNISLINGLEELIKNNMLL